MKILSRLLSRSDIELRGTKKKNSRPKGPSATSSSTVGEMKWGWVSGVRGRSQQVTVY